jgi:hypothetical protein
VFRCGVVVCCFSTLCLFVKQVNGVYSSFTDSWLWDVQEVMHDPVMAADGYTYEKVAIEGWLAAHNTSPLSNAPVPHKQLTPNFGLRSAIREWQGL